MDSLKPADIVANTVRAGIAKSALGPFDLLMHSALSGALLAFATRPAIGATAQTGQPIQGGLLFTGLARDLIYGRTGESLAAALPAVAH